MAEIELKLGLSPKALARARAAFARLPGAKKPRRETLEATYFDTRGNALWNEGLTLRLRREDGAMVQTVKQGGGLARDEWSDKIDGLHPQLRKTRSGRKARKVLGASSRLEAKFHVSVTRTKLQIVHPRHTIEAALDHGRVHMGRKSEPICELELELKSGHDVAALYDLALRLAHSVPFHIEGRSKSARGYALAAGAAFKVVRAGKLPVQGWQSLGAAFAAAGRAYLGQFTGNVPLPRENATEAVHQMRVGLRRLRGLLKAAKDMLPEAQANLANQRLKRALQALGSARNWDVLRETLHDAQGINRRRTPAHRRLMDAVAAARRSAHAEAAANVAAPALTRTLLEAGQWFERLATSRHHHLETPLEEAAPKILGAAFKRLRRKSKDFAKLTPEERHSLRIAGKNLRYAAELFAPLYKQRAVKAFLTCLKDLQDQLGALNDIHGAHELLQGLKLTGPVALAARESLGRLDRQEQGLLRRAEKAVGRLRAARTFW